MEKIEFSKIRHYLGKTQDQLSHVLCDSPKAVQSYEQGWRNIPSHIEREMMLLLALKISADKDRRPRACWNTKNCPDEWRNNCIVWELKALHFCWYLNGTYCQGEIQRNWDEKIQACRECEVFKEMFHSASNQS